MLIHAVGDQGVITYFAVKKYLKECFLYFIMGCSWKKNNNQWTTTWGFQCLQSNNISSDIGMMKFDKLWSI